MKKFDILSLGSIYFDVISPQFPFETALQVESETVGPSYILEVGGSAVHSMKIAQSLGLNTVFVGKIGNDIFGSIVENFLEESGIHSALIKSDQVQTNVTANYNNPQGQSIYATSGSANQSLSFQDVFLQLEQYLPQTRVLYLGGYFKLRELIPYSQQILELARKNKVLTVLDHGRVINTVTPQEKEIVKQVAVESDFYFPSREEFMDLWGVQSIEQGLEILANHKNKKQVTAIKMDKDGALCMSKNKTVSSPAFSVNLLHTVAAGDSFNTGFIKAYLEKKPFEKAVVYANATAALKISQVELPNSDQVEQLAQSAL